MDLSPGEFILNSVSQFCRYFQVTFLVVYGPFKIFETLMGFAKIRIRCSFSRLVTQFFRNFRVTFMVPLTYEYNEVGEEVLTSAHLIYGRRIKSLPDEIVEPDDALNVESCSARFKYLSTRLSHFLKQVAKRISYKSARIS